VRGFLYICSMKTKICSECHKEKLATPEYFHFQSKEKGTFVGKCKECRGRKEKYKWEITIETGIKECSLCKINKNVESFPKNKNYKDGYSASCIKCYDLHYIQPKKNEKKEYDKERYGNNREEIIQKTKQYVIDNVEKVIEYKKNYYEKNKEDIKEKVRVSHNRRRKEEPLFKLKTQMRLWIYRFIKNKSESSEKIIGCTPIFLKEYIEQLWQPGMTWENWSPTGWHVDHIIPLSSGKTESELLKLNHYTNLKPLWAKDNLAKSNKILS